MSESRLSIAGYKAAASSDEVHRKSFVGKRKCVSFGSDYLFVFIKESRLL